MTKKPSTIPGIYDYCNGWCDRCIMVKFCSKSNTTEVTDQRERERENILFWNKITVPPKDSDQISKLVALKHGIEINRLSEEERHYYDLNKKKENEFKNKHPITKMTTRYIRSGGTWLQFIEKFTQSEGASAGYFNKKLRLSDNAIIEERSDISIYIEVLHWYIYFIYSKSARALNGYFEDDGWELVNGLQRSYDGSAKAALLAIDHSMNAWSNLYNLVPECANGILESLAILERLKQLLEELCPKARMFIRPGFDTCKPGGIPF